MRHCICYNLLQLQPMETTPFITPDLAAVHSLDHHHKVIPEGFNRFNPTFLRIYDRQMEVPLFQPHMVYHQTTIFHMEDFHTGTIRIDKNESVTVPYILSHLVGHDAAKRIKALTHVCRIRVKIISVGFIQRKHRLTV